MPTHLLTIKKNQTSFVYTRKQHGSSIFSLPSSASFHSTKKKKNTMAIQATKIMILIYFIAISIGFCLCRDIPGTSKGLRQQSFDSGFFSRSSRDFPVTEPERYDRVYSVSYHIVPDGPNPLHNWPVKNRTAEFICCHTRFTDSPYSYCFFSLLFVVASLQSLEVPGS